MKNKKNRKKNYTKELAASDSRREQRVLTRDIKKEQKITLAKECKKETDKRMTRRGSERQGKMTQMDRETERLKER